MNDVGELNIYIDGSSKGNPGPSGIGVLVEDRDGNEVGVFSAGIGETTNNMAEYISLLIAVEIVKQMGAKKAKIYTDSELMSKQINGEYRVKNDRIRELVKRYFDLSKGLDIEVLNIKRESNKRADNLARDAGEGLFRNTLKIELDMRHIIGLEVEK